MKTIATVILMAVSLLMVSRAATASGDHDHNNPRHIAMETLGKNMKAISRGVKSGAITADLQKKSVKIVEISEQMIALFPKGAEGPKSRAKAEIWSDAAGFKKANDNFMNAAKALQVALTSGDAGASGAALKATGKTCGGCHKPFRAPKK